MIGMRQASPSRMAGLNTVLYWAVLAVLVLWTVLQFLGVGVGGVFEFWGVGRAMGVLEILMLLSLLASPTLLRRPTRITVCVLSWIPWVFLNVVVSVSGGVSEWLFSGAMPVLLWPLSYLFFYVRARRYPGSLEQLQRYFLGFSVACVVLFFAVFREVNAGRAGNLQQLNAVFFPLLTLPWIALVRKPTVRVLGFALIGIAVLFSLKRTAIIAASLAGVTFVVVGALTAARKSRLRTFLSVVVGVLVVASAYLYVDDSLGVAVTDRMLAAREDGGSGRLTIYQAVLDQFAAADVGRLLFGHGHYSTFEIFGVTAHNDFLEVAFDYGIVGLALYLWLHASLLRKLRGLVRARSSYAAAFGAAYAVFATMSMTSHLIIYPTYFVFLAAFWGAVEGATSGGQSRSQGTQGT